MNETQSGDMNEEHGKADRNRSFFVLVAVATLLGAFLRARRLAEGDLWFDETFTVYLASLGWRDFFIAAWRDIHPPLYYMALKPWIAVFGMGAWSVRGFSLLMGTLCIPAGALVLRRLSNRRAACAAMVCLAVSPVLIHYGQEARMYAFLNLLGILQAAVLWKAISSRPSKAEWFVLAFSTICCLSTHHFYLIVTGAEIAWVGACLARSLFMEREEKETQLRYLRLLFLLLFLGIVSGSIAFLQGRDMADSWLPFPSMEDLALGLMISPLFDISGGFSIWQLAASVLVIIPAVWGAFRKNRSRSGSPGLFFLFLYAFFIIATFVLSHLWIRCYFASRYPAIVLPFFIAGICVGLSRIKPRLIGNACLVLFLACNIWGMSQPRPHRNRPPISSLTNSIQALIDEGTPVIFDFENDLPFYRYHLPSSELHSVNSIARGEAGPEGDVVYLHNRSIFQNLPKDDIVNPHLIRDCSGEFEKIGFVNVYEAYEAKGFDPERLRDLWPDRLYIGRGEAAGYSWVSFMGAESTRLNDRDMFHDFQYDPERAARFRWTRSEKVVYVLETDGENAPGPKSLRICLTAGPESATKPKIMKFRLLIDGEESVEGELPIAGSKREYVIPFKTGASIDTVEFHTLSAVHKAPSLATSGGEVPEVGYLLFWIGVSEEE